MKKKKQTYILLKKFFLFFFSVTWRAKKQAIEANIEKLHLCVKAAARVV